MKRFEEGKFYGAVDTAVPPIEILKRTEKMIQVRNDYCTWRMRIKVDWKGTEYATDSSVPYAWRECYTYMAKYETEAEA